MAFAGLRGTGDWATDERPKNFREMILWRNPNGSAALTALMAKMKSEKTDDPEFNWWEEENNVIRVQTDATGASATSTSFGLTAGGLQLVVGDVLLVEKTETSTYDNEIILISSVTSDTAIVVKRAQSGSSGANTGASAFLTKIGNVFGEGTASPNVSNRNPNKLSNFAQIFKTAYELTRTAEHTRTRTGDPLKNDKLRKMFDHSAAMEYAWMWGQKFEDTDPVNGKPRRWVGGLREFITTNTTIFGGGSTLTEDNFFDVVAPVFDYSTGGVGDSTERIVLAGNGFLNTLNKIVKNSASTQIRYDSVIRAYGMELQKFVIPQGTLYFRTHPLMNTHGKFKNSAFVINPAAIIYRPFLDTKPMDNIQANDSDTRKGQWLTEAGVEVRHEKTMGYIGNFVSV